MLHANNPIIKHKAGLLNLAEELSDVSKTCKVMDVSHDTFYPYQELVENGGIDEMCCGRTPEETLFDGKSIWAEKNLAQI